MGREPAILQSSLQVPLTILSTLRRGLVKNGAMSRSVHGTRREERSMWKSVGDFYFWLFAGFQRNMRHRSLEILT